MTKIFFKTQKLFKMAVLAIFNGRLVSVVNTTLAKDEIKPLLFKLY